MLGRTAGTRNGANLTTRRLPIEGPEIKSDRFAPRVRSELRAAMAEREALSSRGEPALRPLLGHFDVLGIGGQ